MAVTFDHAVRFEEVDAAGIVFFARFFNWCHDAMECFFGGLSGGYVELITKRRIGFPTVHLTADWKAPVRYGDVARVETSVTKIGSTSCTFRHVMTRLRDGVHVATVDQVVVATNLDTMTKLTLPDDARALLEAHRAA